MKDLKKIVMLLCHRCCFWLYYRHPSGCLRKNL